jgi:hypothetical protein
MHQYGNTMELSIDLQYIDLAAIAEEKQEKPKTIDLAK